MSIKGIGSGGPTPIKPPTDGIEAKQSDPKPAQSARTVGDEYESAAPTSALGALLGQPRGAGGEGHVIAIAPGEDRGVKLNPGEEQGIRFAPGEDRGVKLNPGLGEWGDPHVAPAGAGEVRATGLSPASGEVRTTGLSPASGEVRATGLSPADLALPSKPASEE